MNDYINNFFNIDFNNYSNGKKYLFKRNPLSKPIIKNLRLVDATPELLKELQIVDPESPLYIENKDKIDANCQIIMGEVTVNDVTFSIYIVIGKNEKIFDGLLDIPLEKKDEIHGKKSLEDFEKYIIDSLTYLSCVDREVLLVIKNKLNPKLIFKKKKEYDFNLSGRKLAYAGGLRPILVNLFAPNKFPIIHEFGHLFDRALRLTSKSPELYSRLAQKYSKSLKETTWCGGDNLSGYDSKDYEKKIREFFADLFVAFYASDELMDDYYLVSLFDKEAYAILDGVITEEVNKGHLLNIKLLLAKARLFLHKINDMRDYYQLKNDKEMLKILDEVMNKTGLPDNCTNLRNIKIVLDAILLFNRNKDFNRTTIKKYLMSIINQPSFEKDSFKELTVNNDEELDKEKDENESNKRKNELIDYLQKLKLKIQKKLILSSPLIREQLYKEINNYEKTINSFSSDGLSLVEYKIIRQRLQLLEKKIDNNIIINSRDINDKEIISTIRTNVINLNTSLKDIINGNNNISPTKLDLLKKVQLLIEKYLELINDSNFIDYIKNSDTILHYYDDETFCYKQGTIYDIIIDCYFSIESLFIDIESIISSQDTTLLKLIERIEYEDLLLSYQILEKKFYNMLSMIPREASIKL